MAANAIGAAAVTPKRSSRAFTSSDISMSVSFSMASIACCAFELLNFTASDMILCSFDSIRNRGSAIARLTACSYDCFSEICFNTLARLRPGP